MRPDTQAAIDIAKKALPNGKIQKYIEYNGLFVFQIFTDDPGEEEYDPFYSVNKETGEFREFSIITDGNIKKIVDLFEEAKPFEGGVK